jgi:phosphate transport system substrate-binding protein
MIGSTRKQRRGIALYTFVLFYLLSAILLLFSACSPGRAPSSSPSMSQSSPLSSPHHGSLLIVGSTALQPLTTFAASLFEKRYPGVRVVVRGGGSVFGLDAVSSGQADIGDSDIYADANLYPDPNLTDHIVCIVPFALIVNPAISLTSLTQQQIVDIFVTGKLNNWHQLGGPDMPIAPVVRSDTSGTRASFLRYVLAGQKEMKHAIRTDSSTTMLHTVARVPGAIGYLALSSLDKTVRTLAINGQTTRPEAIASGQYAFWGYEHMYTMSNRNNPMIATFLQFMLTSPIQNQAKRMEYIALDQVQLPINNPVTLSSRISQSI